MQILDTLFGQKRGRRGARCRRERGGVWGGWDGLCCQLPPKMWFSSNNYHYLFPSLTIRDESVMMTSVSFAHSWSSEDFFSQFTPNHHWVSALELFRYSAEEEAIYKRAPCVCSLWSAVCVNTEASAHTGVWTVREVDFFFLLIDLVWVLASYRPEQTQSACKERMAAPTKFSFSVRSILDLPEQDADAAKRSSPIYSSCSSSSPYSSWIDCERSLCMCKWAFKAMRDGW